MQTKKRAKPVKFGKAAKATEIKLEEKETRVTVEEDNNSDEAKEVKKTIEEKTDPKEEKSNVNETVVDKTDGEASNEEMLPEQEEAVEQEPKEVNLSENPPEKIEEEMPLENTETVAEIEPDELYKKEESSNYGSFTNDAVEDRPKGGYLKFFVVVACITFIVGIIIIGGISYFSSAMSNGSTMLVSNPSPSPTIEPSATPTPEKANLTAYSITVLNGSGTTGEAAKAKSLLEGKGFTVGSIGNASTSDYTKTEISAKKSVSQAYINALISALKDTYSVNSVVDTSSSQSTDVVVTIGSNTAK